MHSEKIGFRQTFVAVGLSLAALTSSASLVAHFKMDRLVDGKVPDDSGNGRSLTLGTDAVLADDPMLGKVLKCPGTTKTYASFSCPGMRSSTVMFWLFRETTDSSEATGQPYGYNLVGGAGLLWAKGNQHIQTTHFGDNKPCAIVAYSPCTRGVWHHVAVSFNDRGNTWKDAGGTVRPKADYRLYVDGTMCLGINDVNLTNFVTAAKTGILGNSNNSNGVRPLNGAIGEFKVYDTALSHAEVLEDYMTWRSRINGRKLCQRFKMDAIKTGASGQKYIADACGNCDLLIGTGCSLTNEGPRGASASLAFNSTSAAWGLTTNTVGVLEEYTICFWEKYDQELAQKKLVSGNGNPRGYHFNNSVLFSHNLNGSRTLAPKPGKNVVYALAASNLWHHLTVVVRKKADPAGQTNIYCHSTLYVNGRRANDTGDQEADSAVAKGVAYFVGNSGKAGNRPYAGLMSDFRLYNWAFDEDEVAEAYRDLPTVDAGADVTVYGESGRLAGDTDAERCGKRSSDPLWTCLAAPQGAVPTFANPNAWSTAVRLPVDGAYTFRLTATSLGGETVCDEVTLTRAAGSAVAPTVTVTAKASSVTLPAGAVLTAAVPAGTRLFWSKVSGPGGVYFTEPHGTNTCAVFTAPGDYVLACTAENGGATGTDSVAVSVGGTFVAGVPSDGLLYHWDFDNYITTSGTIGVGTCPRDPLTGSGLTFADGASLKNFQVRGVTGLAWRQLATTHSTLLGTDKLTNGVNYAISFWAYEHSDNPFKVVSGRVFVSNKVLEMQMDQMQTGNPTVLIRLYGQKNGSVAGTAQEFYWQFANVGKLPGRGGVLDRWVHYVINVNVADYTASAIGVNGFPNDKVRVFADGVELLRTANNASAGLANMTNSAGRIVFKQFSNGPQQIRVGLNSTNEDGSRFYPASIDELRVYNRNLTAGEVYRLYQDPFVVNRAPAVETSAGPIETVCKDATPLSGSVADDGLPAGAAVSSAWEVVSGDASKLTLPQTPSGAVTAAEKGNYQIRLKATDGYRTAYGDIIDLIVSGRGMVLFVK